MQEISLLQPIWITTKEEQKEQKEQQRFFYETEEENILNTCPNPSSSCSLSNVNFCYTCFNTIKPNNICEACCPKNRQQEDCIICGLKDYITSDLYNNNGDFQLYHNGGNYEASFFKGVYCGERYDFTTFNNCENIYNEKAVSVCNSFTDFKDMVYKINNMGPSTLMSILDNNNNNRCEKKREKSCKKWMHLSCILEKKYYCLNCENVVCDTHLYSCNCMNQNYCHKCCASWSLRLIKSLSFSTPPLPLCLNCVIKSNTKIIQQKTNIITSGRKNKEEKEEKQQRLQQLINKKIAQEIKKKTKKKIATTNVQ